jgi:hypothetical protein
MGVALDGEDIAPLVQKGKECPIGKLLANRIVPRLTFELLYFTFGVQEVRYLSKS